MVKERFDSDGDLELYEEVGEMTVFAVESMGSFSLNFGLSSEVSGSDWMETLTGKGAFSTIKVIRPAVERIVKEIESRGKNWSVCCDSRRAKFYSRYLSIDKIKVI